MDFKDLVTFAESQRGQGWLGAMNIIDRLNDENIRISRDQSSEIKQLMHICFGKVMLNGHHGGDEHATKFACDQSIESVVTYCRNNPSFK